MIDGSHLLGIEGLTAGGIGVWGLFASFVAVVFKSWPAIQRAVTEARIAMGSETRANGDWFQDRLEQMERRLDATETRANELERKFTLSLAAYRIVVSELHRINPKSAVIAQAQKLLGPDMMADLPDAEPVGPMP